MPEQSSNYTLNTAVTTPATLSSGNMTDLPMCYHSKHKSDCFNHHVPKTHRHVFHYNNKIKILFTMQET